jgi:hypothetical protein
VKLNEIPSATPWLNGFYCFIDSDAIEQVLGFLSFVIYKQSKEDDRYLLNIHNKNLF